MNTDREIQQAAMVDSRPAGGPEFIAHFDPVRIGLLLDVLDAARRDHCRGAPCLMCDAIAAYDALDKETE